MRLLLHPKVYSDIDSIMAYYEEVATTELANDFYAELRHFLHRFPYHFLFRAVGDAVRILVVRHHSRHPSLGTGRR